MLSTKIQMVTKLVWKEMFARLRNSLCCSRIGLGLHRSVPCTRCRRHGGCEREQEVHRRTHRRVYCGERRGGEGRGGEGRGGEGRGGKGREGKGKGGIKLPNLWGNTSPLPPKQPTHLACAREMLSKILGHSGRPKWVLARRPVMASVSSPSRSMMAKAWLSRQPRVR